MLRLFAFILYLVGSVGGPLAWAQSGGGVKSTALPDFDIREVIAASPSDRVRAAAAAQRWTARQGASDGLRVSVNRRGIPRMMFRDGRPLSAPSDRVPEAAAMDFLRTNAAFLSLNEADLGSLRLIVKDVTESASFVVFNQTVNGIDVFNGQIKVTLSRTGEVLQVGAADLTPRFALSTTPRLSPEQAVRKAFSWIHSELPGELVAGTSQKAGVAAFRNPRGQDSSALTAELTVFPISSDSARLAYRVFLDADPEHWFEILVDADSGELLLRHNLWVSAGSARVWTESPMQSAREVVTFPEGWLPSNGDVARGNNADAYVDSTPPFDWPDIINSAEMTTGRAYSPNQVFDFEFGDGTMGLDPRAYKPASVTNLFYFLNKAHDYFYSLGFNETAGNFQTDNFDRGGLGNDAVIGQAQFGGFSNNAAFAPTPDGTAPRIRMGLFTRSTSSMTDDLDSSYSGDVVFHEYAHGVTSRIVGGTTSTSCLRGIQSAALAEGWSDYFAASFFNNPATGAYLAQNPSGIRRYSYEGYPLTYEDVGNSAAGYEAHRDGEIWAAALWDLRKSLGPEAADRVVFNGLKSTLCSASMTEARDAILAAEQATSGGTKRAAIWEAFARHGLGYSATGVDGSERAGTRYDAAYDSPPDLQPARGPAITSDPLSVATALGAPYTYRVAATSPGGALTYSLADGPAGMSVDAATGQVNWTAGFTPVRVKITVTDGSGKKVVHGYRLPVITTLTLGNSVTIAGAKNSTGYATLHVPDGVQVLQLTLRGSAGDADLRTINPAGASESSMRVGPNETLSFLNPPAGLWQIEVAGYRDYSGLSLSAMQVIPTALGANTTLVGLSAAESSETLFRVTIPSGTSAFSVRSLGGTGDVDLYARYGQPALCQADSDVSTNCFYDRRSTRAGNTEAVGFGNPTAGDWYILLSAFEGYSGLSLVTSTVPMSILTESLPPARSGAAYCFTLGASGGTTSYQWSLTSGSILPDGLRLSSSGGITGVPTTPGMYTFTVRVTDASQVILTRAFTLTVGDPGQAQPLSIVSAASYAPGAPLAPDSISAIFGAGNCMAPNVAVAPSTGPLPVELNGASVKITDSSGSQRDAPLWFVAPEQINYLVPSGTASGSATVTVMNQGNPVASGTIQVETVAPGLFTMNANGQGAAAALAIQVSSNGSQSWRYIFLQGCFTGSCITTPIEFGDAAGQLYLQLYGTGIRGRSGLGAVSATIGGENAPVEYAGPVEGATGLDQVNVKVPRALIGRGEVDVIVKADGKTANTVKVNFQ